MIETAEQVTPFDNSIRDPLRIQRIMKKISDASVPVVLRIDGSKPVSIKARVAGINATVSEPHLVLDQLSWRADQFLKTCRTLRVDLIGMSASVHFHATILSRSEGHVIVTHPTKIESIERRSNRRALITGSLPQCFLRFYFNDFDPIAPTATPFMNHCLPLSQFARACDLSLSGVCLIYRFPEIGKFLRPGVICEKVDLQLPLLPPISVGIRVRWVRKIRERIQTGINDQMSREFRAGLEFLRVDAQLKQTLGSYMKRIEVGDVV